MEATAVPDADEPSLDSPVTPQSLGELVEQWWADHFPGSPVAQATAAWNHALAAKEALKRRLANLAPGAH